MGYATGRATTVAELYNAVYAFALANGWTAHDATGTSTPTGVVSKVIKSLGVNNDLTMYFHMVNEDSVAQADRSWKSETSLYRRCPQFYLRGYGYWDAVGHTGQKPFFEIGNALGFYSSAAPVQTIEFKRFSDPLKQVLTNAEAHTGFTLGTPMTWDWPSKMLARPSTTELAICDLVGNAQVTLGAPASLLAVGSTYCYVYSKADDKHYIYYLKSTSTLVDQWERLDMATGTLSPLASPGWTASGPANPFVVWDGGDYIYCHHGASGAPGNNEFRRYSISGNSWTSRSVVGATARASVATPSPAVYVPAAVTGTTDKIYAILAASTAIYVYDVAGDSWTTAVGTLPATPSSVDFLLYDHKGSLYYYYSGTGGLTLYQATVQANPTLAGGFTSVGVTVSSISRNNGNVARIFKDEASPVRCAAGAAYRYWLVGNADRINVITRPEAGSNYYWTYIGKYDTSHKREVMSNTAPIVGSTSLQSIPVDSTTGYEAGDRIVLYDPAAGTIEGTSVFDIPDGTHFRAFVTSNFATGSQIGQSPNPVVAISDAMVGNLLLDAFGYQTDGTSSFVFAEPYATTRELARSTPDVRGTFAFWPILLWNYVGGSSVRGNNGFLQEVYLVNDPSGYLRSEDILSYKGSQYLVVKPFGLKWMTPTTMYLAVGPIN